jgi:membrane fusion protein (multidrug efflux system)
MTELRMEILTMRATCILTVCCFAALAAGVGCSDGTGGEDKAGPVADVTLTRVERGPISDTLVVSGTVMAIPNSDVKVGSLVVGRIAEMKVAEGDHVRTGEVLAQVDARPYEDQLTQAEQGVAQAKATLEHATASRARNEDLVNRGIAARKDFEDARTQEEVAKANLRQSEAAVSLARIQVSRAALRSPLDGIVVKRFAGVGEQVDGNAGQPVVEVARLGEVELVVNVPAAYLPRLRAGQAVPLTSDAFPNQKFPGHIVAIPASVDPGSGAGAVRIRIPNGNGLLRLGMFLKAVAPFATHKDALLIPVAALYRDETGNTVVYRVEGNTATVADVKTGVVNQEQVEIVEGLAQGDTIVLTGGYGLGEKTQIKVKAAGPGGAKSGETKPEAGGKAGDEK